MFGLALVLLSAVAALVAARVTGPSGPWLWNLDLPKIHYPLAVFFHDALAAGRLPLWNDELGLGFPLYAEGQVGAFYPPNWLLFQLPPLVALDATRVLHLAVAGTGAGWLVLRLSGSRVGALVAAAVAILGGAITAKLEWHNLVTAYAFVPWILLPLVRRPAPTRACLVVAGVLFGLQALAGHPNTWLLTGIAAAVVLIAVRPTVASVARVAAFGALGAAVGAVQLVPTALLTTLSVRTRGLSADDLFTSAATPFDPLGFAFGAPFALVEDGAWNLFSGWYPDGSFALFEAAAYVGLPVLALALVGAASRRSRPLVAAIFVLLAIAVVAGFRPGVWMDVPLLNALRSPVRSYLLAALFLGVLAGIGVGRLGRLGATAAVRPVDTWNRVATGVAVPVGLLGLVLVLLVAAPEAFDRLFAASSTFLRPEDAPTVRDRALAALSAPWPLGVDLAAGAVLLVVVRLAARRAPPSSLIRFAAVACAVIPLVLLGPLPNGARERSAFDSSGSEFVRAVAAAEPYRVLTLEPPGFYPGMPDQLAAAGIRDLRMFSSLDLLATAAVTERAAAGDPDGTLRRALGVDVVVTFDRPCPGRPVAAAPAERAAVCRDDRALRPPYWLPASVVDEQPASAGLVRASEASFDPAAAAAAGLPATVSSRGQDSLTVTVDAPAAGYLWIDRAWWPAWQTSVDGTPVEARLALGGQLVPLGPGRHAISQALLPWDALVGLAAGAVALTVVIAWAFVAPRLRRPAAVGRVSRWSVSPSARRRP